MLVSDLCGLITELEKIIQSGDFYYSEVCDPLYFDSLNYKDWVAATLSQFGHSDRIYCKNERLELIFEVYEVYVSWPILAKNGLILSKHDDLPKEIIINLDQIELTFEEDLLGHGAYVIRF